MTKRRNDSGGGEGIAAVQNDCVDKPALRQLASRHAKAAIDALAAVMGDSSATPAARVSAAMALLGWGFGRSSLDESEPSAEQVKERIVRLVWGGPPLGAQGPDIEDS